MTPNRPKAVLVIAILNFVFGGLWLLYLTCVGIVVSLFAVIAKNMPPPPPGQPNPMEVLRVFEAVPGYIQVLIVAGVSAVLIHVVLIVAGFGLLKMRPWGRWASVAYAVVMIVGVIAFTTYTIVFVNPAVIAWAEDFNRKMGAAAPPQNPTANTFSSAGSSLVYIAYPIALLIVLFMPSVSAAFAGRPGRRRRRADEGEEEYDDRFREG